MHLQKDIIKNKKVYNINFTLPIQVTYLKPTKILLSLFSETVTLSLHLSYTSFFKIFYLPILLSGN